jgi:hypothetical protein
MSCDEVHGGGGKVVVGQRARWPEQRDGRMEQWRSVEARRWGGGLRKEPEQRRGEEELNAWRGEEGHVTSVASEPA